MTEIIKLKKSIFYAILFSIIFLISFLVQSFIAPDIINFGLIPRQIPGLKGVLFAPLLHSSFSHFFSNIIPIALLSFLIFYHFKQHFIQLIVLVWVGANILTWISARDANHIGASGIVYGLAFYLITLGIILKDRQSLAIALFVIFLYGSLIWGMFPNFIKHLPEKNISWESHLWGGVMGIISGLWFHPKKTENEPFMNEDEQDDEDPYWMIEPNDENNNKPLP